MALDEGIFARSLIESVAVVDAVVAVVAAVVDAVVAVVAALGRPR